MNNYKIKINIEILEESKEPISETPQRLKDGGFELNISSDAAENIDDCEQYLLETNYAALRYALGKHLEAVYKKNLSAMAPGVAVIAKETEYRVEGEIGRFSFPIYELANNHKDVESYNGLNQLFPPLVGKTWYRTRGFKELTYVHGTPEESYRKTSAWLNRVRHQPNATSFRTLQSNTEAEGQRIIKAMEEKSNQILKANKFSDEGIPLTPRKRDKNRLKVFLSEEIIEKAFQSNQIPETIRSSMKNNPVPYENPIESVNISIDDVGVKEQKTERIPEQTTKAQEKERHHTYQTVVHISNHIGSYVFNTLGTVAAMPILIAFLFHNQLLSGNLLFFVDGQRSLQTSILNAFSWFTPHQLILDWYHLEEKCKKQLSTALNGRNIRNEVLSQLLYWLWHGLVDKAIEYLGTIDTKYIKANVALEQLKGYFNRNIGYIPCYSIRKILGLRNSSNQGEKCNDLLVSERQKHNGMSWSQLGSVTLAAVTALVRNNETTNWFRTGEINFRLVPRPIF